jgi:hypothetical protein
MEQIISRGLRLSVFIALLLLINLPAYGRADEVPMPRFSTDDFIPFESVLSFFRYGSFGLGIFPYLPSLPGAPVEIRVDGVPLPSFSPFGPDLERIKYLVIDSLAVNNDRTIWIATPDSIPAIPVTRINFLSGDKRRFRFQTTFLRRVNNNTGIFACGSSDGIHKGEVTQGNSSRDYLFKYFRSTKNGGLIQGTINGGFYRTDLSDLVVRKPMGSGELEHLVFSLGVKNYRLSENTNLFSTAYYRSGTTKLDRFNIPSNYDDNSFGALISLKRKEKKAIYGLDVTIDSRQFKGRTIDVKLQDTVSKLKASGSWFFKKAIITAIGGGSFSSRYGAGGIADGSLTVPLKGKIDFIARGSFSHETPDQGNEIYSSLSFSDTVRISHLRQYHVAGLETGIKVREWGGEWGIYGFSSQSDAPFFTLNPPSSIQNAGDVNSGLRATLFFSRERKVRYEGFLKVNYIGGSSSHLVWPHPAIDADVKINASRIFFGGALHAALFGEARLFDWKNGPSTPKGFSFFLDSGISAKVSSLLIYYKVENLTNENVEWFDTLGWQGMNSLWGVKWELRS